MAQVKIEGIFDHLGHEIIRALEETIKEHFPRQKHDIRAVFRTFVRKVYYKCNTWENVPDSLVKISPATTADDRAV